MSTAEERGGERRERMSKTKPSGDTGGLEGGGGPASEGARSTEESSRFKKGLFVEKKNSFFFHFFKIS